MKTKTGKLSSPISIELVDSCKGETDFIINIVSIAITNIKIIGIVRNVTKHFERIFFLLVCNVIMNYNICSICSVNT